MNLPPGIVTVLGARHVLVESRAAGTALGPDLRGAALLAIAQLVPALRLIKEQNWNWFSIPTIEVVVTAVLTII
ncbi:hypothetical protein [Mycobacterium uberis]|uniref:hypothetical protein n=1 Tax=Mycobacterium uberis TaxID=2162698 RepID=UPI00105845B7|nr:hypothetical protein [Mycobacterium uberis]